MVMAETKRGAGENEMVLQLGMASSHPSICSRSAPEMEAQLVRLLGEGAHGQVFKVLLRRKPSGSSKKDGGGGFVSAAALKVFKIHSKSGADDARKAIAANEIYISLMLSDLAAPSAAPIVRALQVHGMTAEDGGGAARTAVLNVGIGIQQQLCMTMEFCEGGSLMDFVSELGRPMTEEEAASFLHPVAIALEFCHAHRVLHLDVKPTNVLLKKKGQLRSACLSDFGSATFIPSDVITDGSFADAFYGIPSGAGTRGYMAPELAASGVYSPRADVFSLGCLLLRVLTGICLSSSATEWKNWRCLDGSFVEAMIAAQPDFRRRQRWSRLSEPAKQLILGMLCPDPVRRLSLDAVLRHSWLSQHIQKRQPKRCLLKMASRFKRIFKP